MQAIGIAQARARLERARAAAALLSEDITIVAKQAAWSDFLIQANVIMLKLEEGAKGHGKSEYWFGRLARTRRLDPLLSYIHHARNADEHTLAAGPTGVGRVAGAVHPAGFQFGLMIDDNHPPVAPGRVETWEVIPGAWRKLEDNGGWEAAVTPTTLWLKPVHQRGRDYDPPGSHLGNVIGGHPPEVAQLAIAFFESAIADAERLPPH